jgi:hypothetical protein
MKIKRFNESVEYQLTKEDELGILDIFQDLDDEWQFSDLMRHRSHKNINYLFLGLDPVHPSLMDRQAISDVFHWNGIFQWDGSDPMPRQTLPWISIGYQNRSISFYFDISGPNDFYTTRLKFLEDLQSMADRINSMFGFESKILKDRYRTTKFILYITK